MKLKILTLIAVGLVFFSSCSNKEIDPVLEIYITTKASEKWQHLNMENKYISFSYINSGGYRQYISTEPFHRPSVIINADLQEEQSMLVFNDRQTELDEFIGVRLHLNYIYLKTADQGDLEVGVPSPLNHTPFEDAITFEHGKTYKIDLIFDLDEMIQEVDGQYRVDSNFEVEIIEL